MAPKLDLAIVEALSLDTAVTSIASHGGSGFSSTAKITTQVDGEEKLYFIKMGSGKDAETMFAGEYTGSINNPLQMNFSCSLDSLFWKTWPAPSSLKTTLPF
jgi:hypothetical protein